MRIEKLTRRGKEFAIIPFVVLKRLIDDAEMLVGVKAYDHAKGRLDRGDDELIPLEITERRLAGENPIKLWRKHRAPTQEALAEASSVSRAMIAAMETGHKTGSIATLMRLAAALQVDLENLT